MEAHNRPHMDQPSEESRPGPSSIKNEVDRFQCKVSFHETIVLTSSDDGDDESTLISTKRSLKDVKVFQVKRFRPTKTISKPIIIDSDD